MSKPKRPDFSQRSQWFITVDDLYAKRLNYLISFASSHLYQNDAAFDVVHDAIVKSIEYFKKPINAGRKVFIRNIEYQILKNCKKHNKMSSVEKCKGLMGINGEETDE